MSEQLIKIIEEAHDLVAENIERCQEILINLSDLLENLSSSVEEDE